MTRTIRIKLFKFDELSEQSKAVALNDWRAKGYDNQHYFNEIIDSVKAVVDLFNLKTGREWTDIRTSHIDDNILQLTGVRLYKYLVNNYYSDLFTPKYIKTIDKEVHYKPFICKGYKGANGSSYTQLFSRMKVDNCCPLTGVCYDNDILQPIYNFLSKIDTSATFEDLIQDIENSIQKCFDKTEEWLNSDEFISEDMRANDFEFTKEGHIY